MNKPIQTFREKGLSVTVWPKNQTGDMTFSIRKTYKDKKTDEWKESKSLFLSDLKALLGLVQQTINFAEEAAQPDIQQYQQEPLPSPFDDDDIPF